ncbi:transposase [Alcaligenes faecalis]|uniref:transposase n=1 Tax=Alcaligenes TaxID=507 RepID=UPI0023A9DB47|nr:MULTISPECIES: transposase [Alcaligenes]WEA69522.1 transposase [Alcaligenes faecalis]
MGEQFRPKSRYRTTNRKSYSAALKTRGSLTFWLDMYVQSFGDSNGKRGRSLSFFNAASQFYLTNKSLFALALRQAMRSVESLLYLSRLDCQCSTSAQPCCSNS